MPSRRGRFPRDLTPLLLAEFFGSRGASGQAGRPCALRSLLRRHGRGPELRQRHGGRILAFRHPDVAEYSIIDDRRTGIQKTGTFLLLFVRSSSIIEMKGEHEKPAAGRQRVGADGTAAGQDKEKNSMMSMAMVDRYLDAAPTREIGEFARQFRIPVGVLRALIADKIIRSKQTRSGETLIFAGDFNVQMLFGGKRLRVRPYPKRMPEIKKHCRHCGLTKSRSKYDW
jgi:hypothetical protein